MGYVFEPAPVAAALIDGTEDQYPVNRIFCVGRNYEAHVREMGKDPNREVPFYFTKSPSTLLHSGETLPYPPGTENFHHEMELVVAIGKAGFKVSEEEAGSLIYGYATGLDMTRRDLQLVARDKGRPWDLGKDVEGCAVLAPIHRSTSDTPMRNGKLWMSVNGEMRQEADIAQLIWDIDEIISNLSNFYHLVPGDLIYTGTPAGVGPVVPGDVIEGGIDGLTDVKLTIGAPE